MELSKNKEREAAKFGVPTQTLVMADLMSIGYSASDAYSIAYSENSMLSFQQNQSIRDGIVKSGRFNEVLQERIDRVATRVPQTGKTELISIEESAREVLKTALSLPENSKERGELMIKYATLLRQNTTVDAEPEEDNIRIYLPLKCNDCPLLQEYNEKQKEIEEARKAKMQEDSTNSLE